MKYNRYGEFRKKFIIGKHRVQVPAIRIINTHLQKVLATFMLFTKNIHYIK